MLDSASDKDIYESNKELLQNIDKSVKISIKDIIEKEKEFTKMYYSSDSYVGKECKRKYTEYTKQVKDEISKIKSHSSLIFWSNRLEKPNDIAEYSPFSHKQTGLDSVDLAQAQNCQVDLMRAHK